MRRRRCGSSRAVMRARSLPKTEISPRVGFSDRNSSRSSVVLPAPGGPAQELERALGNVEGEVAEDLRTHPVAQADIFEADQLLEDLDCGAASRTVLVETTIGPHG